MIIEGDSDRTSLLAEGWRLNKFKTITDYIFGEAKLCNAIQTAWLIKIKSTITHLKRIETPLEKDTLLFKSDNAT